MAGSVSPRFGFVVGSRFLGVIASPSERLPRRVDGGAGVLVLLGLAPSRQRGRNGGGGRLVRACGLAPFRCGVERRRRVNSGRVGKNAVEREAVVGAVYYFGDGSGGSRVGELVGRARVRICDVAVRRTRGGGGRR